MKAIERRMNTLRCLIEKQPHFCSINILFIEPQHRFCNGRLNTRAALSEQRAGWRLTVDNKTPLCEKFGMRVFLKSLLIATAILVVTVAGAYAASGDLLWARDYDIANNVVDNASDVGVRSGNIFVTGTSGNDYATIKYRAGGRRAWVRRFDGPASGKDQANALAIGQGNNVVVTGASQGTGGTFDYLTIKYSTTGTPTWVRRFNAVANGADIARAVTIDTNGNVYVTGSSRGATTGLDYATVKYSSRGRRQWVRRYNGPGNATDIARAVSVDATGNIFVTGRSQGTTTGADYATVKYNSSGQRLWVSRYNGPASGQDAAWGLTVDNTGNVTVTGDSRGTTTGIDYATVQYDTSGGVERWTARYNNTGTGADRAKSVKADNLDNIIVTGESTGTTTGVDYATISYSATGTQQWVQRFNAANADNDRARELAIDADRNVYITGTSSSLDAGDSSSVYLTLKYNGAGGIQWARQYGSVIPSSFYSGVGIAVGNFVYVAGTKSDRIGTDYATLKYER